MKTSPLARQLQLIDRLHSPRGGTLEELATHLQCSTRTVFRDLNCLEQAGIDVVLNSDDKRYCVAPHFGLPVPRLSADELLALTMAAISTPLARLPEISTTLEQAIGKLSAKTPAMQRAQIVRIVQASRIAGELSQDQSANLMIALIAMAGNMDVRVTCRTTDGRTTVHDRITLASLQYDQQQWSIGYRVSADGEMLILPFSHVVEIAPCMQSSPARSRHLLSGGHL